MIAIVNTGGSNLSSVSNAIDRLDCPWIITQDPDIILKAEKVLLPGVGAARASMDKIIKAELSEMLPRLTQPTLGICLGMQLLFEGSDEGQTACLGMIPGRVTAIPRNEGLTLPHMGWNRLSFKSDSALLKNVEEGSFVYFVHSFQGPINQYTKAATHYGVEIPALVEKDNFFGAQFHPEKSAAIGQTMLRNFIAL
ncbi:imidazole glycerol phosphate synthase subunit HisH [Pseudobacteriovorax antillogorgiicola]|uniref:Imidazole glycerol phosphate synthase subunit HisH n=1 Tax=Pseudobacteriovorax antillogorgiicola TaxID=1513793 RepID=A0A1Y6CVS6_9BACT|nr:imidazole glycerol phosphate synthase subunit HisH [Pseudobacteriovorax antillogorgiicola]TCS44613.1 imidazole glycerol phosphate synthase subunit HisH [Pseudobacteriovorax antillogorgiicola]SMF78294.1 imidazole glycerol phosphate synthase subunit hisH [Pseudobacteriovorax antillogorgiicola]